MAIIGVLIGITFSGATYIYSAQQEKKALADMEALRLALEEFKSEQGDYPRTNDLEGDVETLPSLTGKRLFLALSSYVDKHGEPYGNKEDRPKTLIKSDVFSFGEKDGDNDKIKEVTLDLSDLGDDAPECFVIDPWGNPYVYDYPRRDGRKLGYLLFSVGKDEKSFDFTKAKDDSSSAESENDDDLDNVGEW